MANFSLSIKSFNPIFKLAFLSLINRLLYKTRVLVSITSRYPFDRLKLVTFSNESDDQIISVQNVLTINKVLRRGEQKAKRSWTKIVYSIPSVVSKFITNDALKRCTLIYELNEVFAGRFEAKRKTSRRMNSNQCSAKDVWLKNLFILTEIQSRSGYVRRR